MGGGGGPEAEFYGGPAPRGWRTVPEGRAGGGSAGVRGRGVAWGLVAASGAVVAGRRKGRPRSPFLRGDTAGTFPRRRFLSRRGVHPMPEMAIFASASDAASLRRAELR